MLTFKGWLTLAAAIVGILTGLILDNPLLAVTGILFIILIAVSGFLLKRVAIKGSRKVSADVLTEDGEVRVSVTLNTKGGRGFAEIRDAVPGLVEIKDGSNFRIAAVGSETLEIAYTAKFPVKGRHRLGPLRVRVRDVFGFFHDDQDLALSSLVTVYPRIYDLKDALVRSRFAMVVSGDYMVGQPGYGSSFFALREYQNGDSFRSVNWKASARSMPKLIVNQTERESQARIIVLFDARESALTGTPRDNAATHGARAIASIASFVLKRRNRLRFITYGDGIKEYALRGDKQLISLNDALADLSCKGDTGLEAVVNDILPGLKSRAPVLIISNLLDDPTLASAIRTLRAYKANVLVVSPSSLYALEKAGVAQDSLDYTLAQLERDEILAQLKSFGAWAVDWRPNEPLTVTLAREAMIN